MVSLDQDFSFITEGLKANVKFAFDTQAWHGNKYTQQDEIWHAVRRDAMAIWYSTLNRKVPKEVHGLVISQVVIMLLIWRLLLRIIAYLENIVWVLCSCIINVLRMKPTGIRIIRIIYHLSSHCLIKSGYSRTSDL